MVCSSTVCSMSELNCLHYYDEYNLPFVNSFFKNGAWLHFLRGTILTSENKPTSIHVCLYTWNC